MFTTRHKENIKESAQICATRIKQTYNVNTYGKKSPVIQKNPEVCTAYYAVHLPAD